MDICSDSRSSQTNVAAGVPSDPYHLDKCNTGERFAAKIYNKQTLQLSATLLNPRIKFQIFNNVKTRDAIIHSTKVL